MTESTTGARIREILNGFLEKVFAEQRDIELLAVATLEGISIAHVASETVAVSAPRLANLSGTLLGLGKDLTASVLQHNPGTMSPETMSPASVNAETMSLETGAGNVCLAYTTFANHACILTIAASAGVSLAKTRLTTVRLAEQIASFGRQSQSAVAHA